MQEQLHPAVATAPSDDRTVLNTRAGWRRVLEVYSRPHHVTEPIADLSWFLGIGHISNNELATCVIRGRRLVSDQACLINITIPLFAPF